MRTVRRLALITSLLVAPPGVAALATEPVLREVLLTTGGVGYFGFEAEPDNEGRIRLTVPLTQVDDLLKSLTVLGSAGVVRSVSLLGPTPLADLYRDTPFVEADLVDLPSLLLRLRGAEVELAGPTRTRGRILTVAREEIAQGDRVMTQHRLSLAVEGGVRSAILEESGEIRLTEPGLQARLSRLMERLAGQGAEQVREVEIALDGAGPGPVALGYLAEAPLWKASWRVVVGAEDGRLQGWAILENASGRDWREVAVTLIGGAPRALRQALFASRYVTRPDVPLEDGVAKRTSRSALAAAAPPEPTAEGILDTAVTTPVELAAQTLFPLPQPVSLTVGHTAMAPIVDRRVPIERIALYRAVEGGPHPQAALRLRNDTGASLPAGLATIYEELPQGGLTFIGDAQVPQTAPGKVDLLAYARDGSVDVTVQEQARARIARARIADGVLEITKLEQTQHVYTVVARFEGAPRRLVLEQPRPDGWRVAAPAGAVVEGGTVRIEEPLPPDSRLELTVVLERPLIQRFGLLDQAPEALLLEFEGADAPSEVRAALARLQELAEQVATIERELATAGERREELARDQQRLRENLGAVPRESDLARRYLDTLATSEDELAALDLRLSRLRAELDTARAARAEAVRTLRI